jgi:peptidyl-prolyl cis-trans isomerase SurA
VDKIIPSHTASFTDDYDLMLQHARSELQNKAINDFIEEKIKTTYIIIDPLYKDCAFEKDGWSEKIRK